MTASALLPALAIYGLIFLFVLRRSIGMARGAPFSRPRLLALAFVYVLLFAFSSISDLYLLPIWTVPVDAAVLTLAALVSTDHVQRTVNFESRADGVWQYRVGLFLPVLFLALYGTRVVVGLIVVGQDPFSPPSSPPVLSIGQTIALAGVNGLFAVSVGLLLGRTAGVIRAYDRLPGSSLAAASGPAPLP